MPRSKSSALVAVIMGSKSDWETMRHSVELLDELGVPNEHKVLTAHRTRRARRCSRRALSDCTTKRFTRKSKLFAENSRTRCSRSECQSENRGCSFAPSRTGRESRVQGSRAPSQGQNGSLTDGNCLRTGGKRFKSDRRRKNIRGKGTATL